MGWGRARRAVGLAVTTAVLATGLAAVAAPAAVADSAPLDPAQAPTVAADALPTVQVNGVVWSQVVVGNAVWATGGFTTARPAGSAPGQNEVDRRNVIVYDIRTGQRDTSFTEWLNATGQVVAASPDGSRVYVGGDFTSASGVRHERIVAFDTATGRVVHSFDAHLDARVSAIAATNDTVYVGGSFLSANGVSRTRLAAFRASDGALLNWAPTAQNQPVQSMVLSPDASTLYVGGKFSGLNGNNVKGLGAVDPVTGATKPLPVANVVRNGGEAGGITSLTVDGDNLYGTGFTFGSLAVGNFEGVFAARLSDGELDWIVDCHGDHYSSMAIGEVVYAAGHAHYCGNVDSFSQTQPWRFDRALAFSKDATGTVMSNAMDRSRYYDFGGLPRPTTLHWYPYMDAGTYTGQNQGPWSVTGNADYVAYGGEFTRTNQYAQQGLVRFARTGLAPNAIGPQSGSTLTPTVETLTPGTARVAWQTSWDYDNRSLTYRVVRNGQVGSPIHTVTVDSTLYDRPWLSFTDTGLTPGTTYAYRIYVTDALGNENRGSTVTHTVGAGAERGAYAQRVAADGARHHWRFGESSGTARDWGSAGDDAAVGSGVTRSVDGAIVGDADRAARFGGSSSSASSSAGAVMSPQVFSVEAWFRTSSTAGGGIIGFGNDRTGSSDYADRSVFVDSGGRVSFGVFPGIRRTIRSGQVYRDNQWHHVVATLGPDGQRLYVDGQLVAQDASSTTALPVTGHWRIGGDNLNGFANRPSSSYLNGSIDEVAVYDGVLTPQQVAAHHALGRGQTPANTAPTAAFTAQAEHLSVSFDATGSTDVDGAVQGYAWTFGDGGTATGPTPKHDYAAAGSYDVTLTVTDDDGASSSSTQTVTVTEPPPNQPPAAAFTAQPTDLTVVLDGQGSTDADGTVQSWSWDLGDGNSASGATTTHTYTAAGTYDVTLTVTDDDGATAQLTQQVQVTDPPAGQAYAQDGFERTFVNGWGLTDTGGAWALSGGSASHYQVADGRGHTIVPLAGQTRSVYLDTFQQASTETRLTVTLDKEQTGGGTYVSVIGRRVVGTGDYRLKLRYLPGGSVIASLVAVRGGENTLASAVVPGLNATPGQPVSVRLQVSGTEPTLMNAKVWDAATAEPQDWTVTATDATAALQQPGSIGMQAYVSGSATNAPITVSYDDLWVGTLGGPQ
ncbi:hypothetical protein GCM10027194_27540 [Thalassiella azotivora]